MMIKLGALVPHAPISVAGVGRPGDLEQIKETITAMGLINEKLAQESPETLVVFTPHGTVYADAIIVYKDLILAGGLERFGLKRKWQWETDLELAEKIAAKSLANGLPTYGMTVSEASRGRFTEGLDHGVIVPLSFFKGDWITGVKLVVIPLSYLPLEELYQFGKVVQEAAMDLNRKVAVIASGDLSHCLKPGAPAPYDPRGEEFDRKIVELINQGAIKEFFELDPVLLEKAAECGFRSLIMLLGTLDGLNFESKVHSYQGPFGVGYGVASFHPVGEGQSMVDVLFRAREDLIKSRQEKESPLVRYARQVIESHLKGEKEPSTANLDDFLREKAGVFVSIKKHGQLRGCIGTTEPTQTNIIEEIKMNAISAATRDPRFEPVSIAELDDLVYSVDVLKKAEPITGMEELDPARYGVIVRNGYRTGLLLPNLEGIETAAEQVAIARKKAGIGEKEPVKLERFEVVRYL